MIAPGWLDLVVYQGATFDQTVNVELDGVAWNLTGYTGTLIARRVDDTAAALTLTEADGMALGNGTIILTMTAAETAALEADRYPYQIEVTTGGTVSRALEGTMRVVPELTA